MDYFKFGSGEKTLVIIPGTSVQSVMGLKDAVAEAYSVLAEDFTLYLLDYRNDPPKGYTIYDMASEAADTLKGLGLNHISLFGTSMGGMVSMTLAARHPELIDKLAVSSTIPKLGEEEFRIFEKWIGIAEKGDAEELYLTFGEAVYPKEVFESARSLYVDAAKTVTPEELERFIGLTNSMRGFDITGELGAIGCPMLVIGDREDAVFDYRLIQGIPCYMKGNPEVEIYMYDGYGHGVYDLASDFKERLKNFFLK